MNIFEQASRQKIRFDQHTEGKIALTTEHLWDLPISEARSNGLCLADLLICYGRIVQEMQEAEKITGKPHRLLAKAVLRLAIIKHIIKTKEDEKLTKQQALMNEQERQRLLGLLAEKRNAADQELTAEQLQARIDELSK